MPLYHIQDDDRPAFVKAKTMNGAIKKWSVAVQKENEQDELTGEPKGITFLCEDYELLIDKYFEAL